MRLNPALDEWYRIIRSTCCEYRLTDRPLTLVVIGDALPPRTAVGTVTVGAVGELFRASVGGLSVESPAPRDGDR